MAGLKAPAVMNKANSATMDDSNPLNQGLLDGTMLRLSLLEKSDLLEATQWANDFSFQQIKKMATYMDVYQVPKNTVLFHEGDKNAFWALIVLGQVQVIKYDSRRTPQHIASLGPGKTIGEMCIVDGEPRSATAVVPMDTTLLVMAAENLKQLFDRWPRVGIMLILKISKLMSQYLRQTSGRLIEYMGE
jgi:CRP-like cAMP-binding protein